jgi:tRNA(Ile2) C34 agmatinyltransferase TiaS
MSNRVVQGRMVTPETLAELIEGERPMEAEPIEDADRDCPECGGNVLSVGYKCQDCDWGESDRD